MKKYLRLLFIIGLLACLILPVHSIYAAWLGTWAYRIELTIDTTNVDADLADYPVYINLSTSSGITDADVSAVFDELGANSLKIAVTESDGTTECYVEVVSWDNVGETAELWTKVSNVDDAVDTIIYLYYDNSAADNSTYVGVTGSDAGKAVWDSNFLAVYHMDDNPDTSHIADSTTNALNGTKKGANEPVEAVGIIGKAQNFDGTNDFIDLSDSSTLNPTSAMTIESFLINLITTNKDEWILGRDVASGRAYAFGKKSYSNNLWIQVNGTAKDDETCVTAGTNQYVATTGSAATGWDIYNAGAQVGAGGAWLQPNAVTENTFIGKREYASYEGFFKGLIDEVRVSNIVRPVAHIKANNYNFTDALVTFGIVENMPIDKPINFVATISGNNINLTWENITSQVKIVRGTVNYPTSITDGAVIYTGALETYSDTGLDTDKTQYYYSAWGYDGVSAYSTDYATTSNGGVGMVLIGLCILLIGLTWLTVAKIPVCGILTFGIAIFTWYYLQNNPLPNIAVTSSVATIIMLVLWGWGIMVGLYGAGKIFSKNDSRGFIDKAFHKDDTQRVYNYDADKIKGTPKSNSPNLEERQAAYRLQARDRLYKNTKRS